MRRSVMFWAMYLIIAGLTILVANLFRLSFSTFSVLFAEGLIMLGVYFVTGGSGFKGHSPDASYFAEGKEQTLFFGSGRMAGSSETAKYTIAFSSATIELPEDIPDIIEVTCLFSDVRVMLPKGRAVRVKISAAFGSAGMPGGTISGFGSRETLLGEGVASYLSGDAVFGSLYIS